MWLTVAVGTAIGKEAQVSSQINHQQPALFVHYRTRGDRVFVSCVVDGVSFREMDHPKQKIGKMIVWIDGRKYREVSQAAFVIKQLPPGRHLIKLDVVNLKNVPYGISRQFNVNITKTKQSFPSAFHS